MKLGMKVLICSLILASSSVCIAQQFISPDDAIQSVKTFENNSSLQITCSSVESITIGPSWMAMTIYSLTCTDTTGYSNNWVVDALTGEVANASYGDACISEYSDDPIGPLTQEQCLDIAETFAQSKYADFSSMNFQLDEQEWALSGWHFSWRQQVAYGALTPNRVIVEVNPVNGKVQAYTSSRINTPIPQQPTYGSEQAIANAKSALGIIVQNYVEGPVLSVDPDGMFWDLVIDGQDNQGSHVNYAVRVDAISGQVVQSYEAFDDPKRGCDNSIIWVREGVSKLPNVSVHWLGKQGARIFAGTTIYDLKPSSDTVICGDKQIKLHGKTELVKGRLMVPMELFLIISRRQ
jgi:hypothetical protein